MIFDNIKNYEKYGNMDLKFKKAFQFLISENLETLSAGRYEIDGDDVFALVQEYETKDLDVKEYEAHQRYIDIQYLVQGEENVGFLPVDKLHVTTPYDKEKDIMFLDGEKVLYKLRAGEFFVFFQGEPHMPGVMSIEKRNAKKVVIKIKA